MFYKSGNKNLTKKKLSQFNDDDPQNQIKANNSAKIQYNRKKVL